jgi:hypothetical protein
MMASRLMLSLKKASVKPTGPWSLQTVSAPSGPREAGTLRFQSRAAGVSLQAPEILNQSISGGEDVELEPLPRSRTRIL